MKKLPNVAVKSHQAFIGGLTTVFDDFFPAWFSQGVLLDCHNIEVGPPTYDVESCRLWRKTYYAPIFADITVTVYDPDDESEDAEPLMSTSSRQIVGEIPAILSDGSFVVNGIPAVLIPTLDRSPGVLREIDKETETYQVKVVPETGPWITLVKTGANSIVYARLNKSGLIPLSVLMRALGMDDNDMFDLAESVHGIQQYKLARGKSKRLGLFEKRGRKWRQLDRSVIAGRILAQNLSDIPAGADLVPSDLNSIGRMLKPRENIDIHVLNDDGNLSIPMTAAADPTSTEKSAQLVIGQLMAPKGSGPTKALNSFTNGVDNYNLSRTGLKHIHNKTGCKVSNSFDPALIRMALNELIDFVESGNKSDNTYSLENRRIKSVGDMLTTALTWGLTYWHSEAENLFRQIVRNASKPGRKKKDDNKPKTLLELTPERVTNRKHITSSMRRVLSGDNAQKINQTNPVAEIMNRSRVVIEAGQSSKGGSPAPAARWVDSAQFRRLSASESPEGPNVGLTNFLSMYAQLDKDGFLRSPAYQVKNGKVTRKVDWLSPYMEREAAIALDGFDSKGRLLDREVTVVKIKSADLQDKETTLGRRVNARVFADGEYVTRYIPRKEVTHAIITKDDCLAAAGILIPFVEHDDSTRIAMASAMTRQAIACVRNERPFVSTGREKLVAHSASGRAALLSNMDAQVVRADSRRIIVAGLGSDPSVDYLLLGNNYPSHGPWPRMRVAVQEGEQVEKGQALAFGEAVRAGGIALGQNLRVAYMSWNGYNFEDAIVISERVAHQERLTSIHVHQFTCKVSMTPLGPEEITALNIPDVSESDLVHLDDDGIIHIGSVVKERDILVGKTTPKDPDQLTAEDRLLQLIFDRNLGKVRDTSLRMPPGYDGAVVVDINSMTIKNSEISIEPTERERSDLRKYKAALQERLDVTKDIVERRLLTLAAGKRIKKAPGLKKGEKMTKRRMKQLPMKRWKSFVFEDDVLNAKFHKALKLLQSCYDEAKAAYKSRRNGPGDIPGGSGMLRRIVVTIAYKRRIQVGDKLAGRHGNKGVIAKVVPVEDMPFDPKTGESVDIILNPLGVASRMNVGQLMETHLGWAMGEISERLKRIRNMPEPRRAKSEESLYKAARKLNWKGLDMSSSRAMSDDIAKKRNHNRVTSICRCARGCH